jgi:hypothetical protein
MESGEVPLVAFKDTIVRVYAGISGPGFLLETDVSASAEITREDGQKFPLTLLVPNQKITVAPVSLERMRSNSSESLNFLLPANLSRGTLALKVTINSSCRVRAHRQQHQR